MKDSTTPIKRSQALIQFSREHHFGLLLVWKMRQGLKENIEPIRISDYTIFIFENELREHFKQEEMELYSKLAINDSLKEQAFLEHQQIYQMVNNIQTDKQNTELLKQFADKLENHIRFEERVLFAHLQQHFSEDELKKIEETHNLRNNDMDEKWTNHFWGIKQ